MKPQLNTIWLIVFLMLKRFGHFFSTLSEKTLPDIRSGNEIFSAGPKRFSSVMSDGPTGFGFHCKLGRGR